MTLDDILHELAEVQDRLLELDDDDFDARYRLQGRRDELRALAADHRIDEDAERSDAELLAELAAQRSRLAAIEAERIDLVKQAGGGTEAIAGGDGWGAVNVNVQIDRANGRAGILARIGRLTSVLADRGVEVPFAN